MAWRMAFSSCLTPKTCSASKFQTDSPARRSAMAGNLGVPGSVSGMNFEHSGTLMQFGSPYARPVCATSMRLGLTEIFTRIAAALNSTELVRHNSTNCATTCVAWKAGTKEPRHLASTQTGCPGSKFSSICRHGQRRDVMGLIKSIAPDQAFASDNDPTKSRRIGKERRLRSGLAARLCSDRRSVSGMLQKVASPTSQSGCSYV
ncbi:hypothetical protein EJ04DRAFT_150686 [Polyplosphaeria fusca]|uniref:Uncharacterized protein n=1 Tax=Polyplosphaeria fusca TaxID=682080 RepID=A0A9P4R4Q7_9PLEO|nr:hypothetical protein EJ04DRAFT_150686 [Polyplosphaeria fusca]